MRRLVPAIALSLLALGAAPAGAATVSTTRSAVSYPGGKGVPDLTLITRTLTFSAAPGEANAVTVDAAGGVLTVRDSGAPAVAGPGCAAAVDGVTCAIGDATVLAVALALGDGDDQAAVTIADAKVTADGGAGADVVSAAGGGDLSGGDGDDRLSAGAATTLRGGPGADTLTGSPATDTLDGGTGTDDLDGGTGRDDLSYAGRPDGVTVDLATGTGGAPGEDDRIAGFEDATGGEGPDVLIAAASGSLLRGRGGDDLLGGKDATDRLDGDAGDDLLAGGAGGDDLDGGEGDDRIDGGAGRDAIAARAGADRVTGGPGPDRIEDLELSGPQWPDVLRGGQGDDVVSGGAGDLVAGDRGDDALDGARAHGGPGDDRIDGPHDRLTAGATRCGTGRDTLLRPDDRVRLPRDCERVDPWYFGNTAMRIPPRVRGRGVSVRLRNPCLFASVGTRCRVRATLFARGHALGTQEARWRREGDGARVLRWRLPRGTHAVRLKLVKLESDSTDERGGYSVPL